MNVFWLERDQRERHAIKESFKIFEEPAEMRTEVVNLKKYEKEEGQDREAVETE